MAGLMELIAKVDSNEAGGDGNGNGDVDGTGNGSTIVEIGEACGSEVVEAGNGTGDGDGTGTGNGNGGIIVELGEGCGSEVDVIELPGYRIPRNVQVRVPTGGGGARAGRGNVPAAVVGGGGGGGSGGNVDVVPRGGGGPAVPPVINLVGFQVLRYSFDNRLNLRLVRTHTYHDIIPTNFQSWDLLGQRLRLVFNQVHPNMTAEQIAQFPGDHNPPLEQVTVQNCWPGAVVTFGRLVAFPGEQVPSFAMLNWTHSPFPVVRHLVSCVAVFEVFSRLP